MIGIRVDAICILLIYKCRVIEFQVLLIFPIVLYGTILRVSSFLIFRWPLSWATSHWCLSVGMSTARSKAKIGTVPPEPVIQRNCYRYTLHIWECGIESNTFEFWRRMFTSLFREFFLHWKLVIRDATCMSLCWLRGFRHCVRYVPLVLPHISLQLKS